MDTPTMSGVFGAIRRASSEHAWYHFMFSTYGAWLRADERGFRDPGHRIHSSGDYKRRPPASEHANLRAWVKREMRSDPVRLSFELRARIGCALVSGLVQRGVQLVIIAVAGDHVHGIAKLPVESAKQVIGNVKRSSSLAVRDRLPGQVWAKRGRLLRIFDQDQQRATFAYILGHVREGAWVWTFRDPVPE